MLSSLVLLFLAEELGFESDGLHNVNKALERENALHQALSRVAGDFGKEPMLRLRRFFSSRREPVISTGSLRLDLALGIGGLPRVRTPLTIVLLRSQPLCSLKLLVFLFMDCFVHEQSF